MTNANFDHPRDGKNLDPIAALTPLQKEVLRYVAQGFSSDEIARLLGDDVTTDAVNDRIKQARAKLGGVRRNAAARMLVEAEKASNLHPLGTSLPPLGVVLSVPTDDKDAAVDGDGVREERAGFEEPSTGSERRTTLPQQSRRGQRVLLALATTVLLLAILSLLKPTADGFGWFYKKVAPTFERRDEK